MMKRVLFALLALVLTTVGGSAQPTMPQFSTDGSETWYFVQFRRGGACLQDRGEGAAIRLGEANPINEQLWKLVGTAESFQLVNKAGRYAVVSDQVEPSDPNWGDDQACAKPLRTATSPYAPGFALVASANAGNTDAWEIQPCGMVNGNGVKQCFNQWGGPGVGRRIGFWNTADPNNPLVFIAETDMVYADYRIEGSTAWAPAADALNTLWYTQPATTATATTAPSRWMEYSLPLGNGQLGASLMGGVKSDEIQFNEKTLWSGRSTDNGKYGSYQNFGSVFIENLDDDVFSYSTERPVKNYRRSLSLDRAVGTVAFSSSEGVDYQREYITSYPAGVIAANLTASEGGKINVRFTLASGKPGINAATTYNADGTAGFGGKLETVSYQALLKVVPTGGEMTVDDAGITVRGADAVLLLLTGATDFDPYAASYVSGTSGVAAKVQARVNDAAAKGWNELLAEHVADYQQYYDRCQFALEGASNTMPTDDLIRAYANRTTGQEPNALMLEQLYFAYGRYLEIASSRGVDLPSNLQGIWNNSSSPAWNADIHSNINVQMNYWPAEPTNLSEMHLPFLNYITNMAMNHPEWKSYAAAAGQQRGWTCYTENNIFGGVGAFAHNYVIANAWYATHLWQHYRYTLDRAFLKKAFPTMLSASQFWYDRLKLDTSDGTYVCPNEYSPEHGPSQDGVAHAQQLVAELFANTLAAAAVLGDEAEISAQELSNLSNRYERLDKGLATETYNGDWGTGAIPAGATLLREWKKSAYTAGQQGHRHMSHLMCLYPFSQVTPESPYFQAAVNSMLLRGDASTGWSMGWKINLWARAHRGDRAHDILELALRHWSKGGGGVYYNLYDSHAPFQIDGNFGACAGIAEMVLQSHTDTLRLLPALPAEWSTGQLKGLKAVGDFTVDLAWEKGKATAASITSHAGQPLYISYPGIATRYIAVNGNEVEAEAIDTNRIKVPAQAGDVVTVQFDRVATGVNPVAQHDEALSLVKSGRTLQLRGAAVKQVSVHDLQGKTLQSASDNSVMVDPRAEGVVLVTATTQTNAKKSFKVVLP